MNNQWCGIKVVAEWEMLLLNKKCYCCCVTFDAIMLCVFLGGCLQTDSFGVGGALYRRRRYNGCCQSPIHAHFGAPTYTHSNPCRVFHPSVPRIHPQPTIPPPSIPPPWLLPIRVLINESMMIYSGLRVYDTFLDPVIHGVPGDILDWTLVHDIW